MSGCDHDSAARTRVLVVDDHYIMRRGLTELLNQQPDFMVTAAVNSAETALLTARQEPFDLAIVDISLGGMDGIELTNRLKAEHPHLVVLILSMHDEELYAERASRAGAAGFVAKQQAGEALLHAIRRVLGGERHFRHPGPP